ncbi:hypothetical protein GCK32_017330 [Trichostrongylus colubriformis]|uniref:STAT transcription factor all-alpha domain-containing protein n=1 Tax=Trichostrongylus colubriformis TaxID=6319 RepID=A0AAN8FTL7_TRICO
MSHCSVEELRTGLTNATKETHTLWEENKDLQGRFVNDLNEISRIQQAIAQLEREHRQDQLQHVRHCFPTVARFLNSCDRIRQPITKQNQLISDRLFDWKNRQKLAQVGVPFDNRDVTLDEIQMDSGPQINDSHAHSTASNLTTLADQLTKLLFMLISQSFVVSVQPEPVLKTQHKFVTEVGVMSIFFVEVFKEK